MTEFFLNTVSVLCASFRLALTSLVISKYVLLK